MAVCGILKRYAVAVKPVQEYGHLFRIFLPCARFPDAFKFKPLIDTEARYIIISNHIPLPIGSRIRFKPESYGTEPFCVLSHATKLPLHNVDFKVPTNIVTELRIKKNITERRITVASGSKGNCYICGVELGKTAMKNHIFKAHGGEDGGQECSLLKIEGAYDKDYWLFIDLPVDSSLSDVDKFLRKNMAECCGHLSEFPTRHRKIGKSRKLNTFSAGDSFLHEYDFGTPTESL
jgi:hypothetical protein